ncbi:MAG: hypothetical protein OEU36_22610, partial [Gammaproteobacteria bacterium]|nr:hypothetical protein [Gammaproteobacteria bacterium]
MRLKTVLFAAGIAVCLNATVIPSTYSAPAAPFAEFQRNYALGVMGTLAPWGEGVIGSGVVVATIDSGVQLNHPDLAANIAPGGFNF